MKGSYLHNRRNELYLGLILKNIQLCNEMRTHDQKCVVPLEFVVGNLRKFFFDLLKSCSILSEILVDVIRARNPSDVALSLLRNVRFGWTRRLAGAEEQAFVSFNFGFM